MKSAACSKVSSLFTSYNPQMQINTAVRSFRRGLEVLPSVQLSSHQSHLHAFRLDSTQEVWSKKCFFIIIYIWSALYNMKPFKREVRFHSMLHSLFFLNLVQANFMFMSTCLFLLTVPLVCIGFYTHSDFSWHLTFVSCQTSLVSASIWT